jgi:hypothetical protein
MITAFDDEQNKISLPLPQAPLDLRDGLPDHPSTNSNLRDLRIIDGKSGQELLDNPIREELPAPIYSRLTALSQIKLRM